MYMVFAFDSYYPSGGMRDFIGYAASEEEALGMVSGYDQYQICMGTEIIATGYK